MSNSTKVTKSVLLSLKPITVKVSCTSDLSDEKVLELAKKEALKSLKESFPALTYLISDSDTLTLEDIGVGQVVKYDNTYGIVTKIKSKNKYPVTVRLENGNLINVVPVALKPVNDESIIEYLVTGRPDYAKELGWLESSTAYLVNQNKVIPVVVSEERKSGLHVYPVTLKKSISYFPIAKHHEKLLFDTKTEALKYIKK